VCKKISRRVLQGVCFHVLKALDTVSAAAVVEVGVGTLDEELALKCIGECWECTTSGRSGAVDEQQDDLHVLDFLIFRQHFEMYKKSSVEKG
jgi:hypothetical protein